MGLIKARGSVGNQYNWVGDLANIRRPRDGEQITLIGWHEDSDQGGGNFYYKEDEPKANHNGGTVFSPTVPFSNTADYLDGVGEADVGGTGCWVRIKPSSGLTPYHFGAVGDFNPGTLTGTDDTAALQAWAGKATVMRFAEGKFLASDNIELTTAKIIHGAGSEKSVVYRVDSAEANSAKSGFKLVGNACRYSSLKDFGVEFLDLPSGYASGARIGLNNNGANDVEVDNLRFSGGNVGIFWQLARGGSIENCLVEGMVIADNGVTGYGINSQGSDGLSTYNNSILNCERHAFYIPASGATKAKNQTHRDNYILYNLGSPTPATQQTCFKVFGAENIVIEGNYGQGLKKAYWFTDDINGLHAKHNRYNGMTVRGADDENIPGGATLVDINIDDEFDNCQVGIFATGGLGGNWEDLNANGCLFKNMTTGLQPTTAKRWSFAGATFENLTNGVFTAAGVTAPPTDSKGAKFISCTNNITNFPSGGNSNMTGDTTPDVSDVYEDYWVANTVATTITNFDGGHHGQEFALLFVQGTAITTIQNGSGIYTRSGANVAPANNSIMKFKNIRGTWREI